MDRLLILFSTLPALLQPAIPALQGIIEVAKKPTDRDGPYRRYLSVVQSMSTAILQRAKEVNLEAFVLGHVGLGRLARAPESLERAARRRLGDLAPLAKEANALLTLIETTTHDIKATHTFLQPLTNFDVTDAPYSLLVHTGKRDSVSATIGGLKDFAKRWELITNTYGTLLGRAPGDGQLTRLSQGSLIAGIVVALPVLLTVLEIVHTALEILKGFNDIKLQRLKFEQEAERRGLPLDLSEWLEQAEAKLHRDFEAQATNIVEAKLKEIGIDSPQREGVAQANEGIFAHLALGGTVHASITGQIAPEAQSLMQSVERAQDALTQQWQNVNVLEDTRGQDPVVDLEPDAPDSGADPDSV